MFCPNCGKEVHKDAKFCQYCATKLSEYAVEENETTSETDEKSVENKKVEEPIIDENIIKESNSTKTKKGKKSVLNIVIIVLVVILIAMICALAFILKNRSNDEETIVQETTQAITAEVQTTEEVTTEVPTTEKPMTMEPTTEEPTTKKEKKKKTTAKSKDFDSIIQTIKDNYYGIQNNLGDFTKSSESGVYDRWVDGNGTMRKIVLPPNEAEFRELTNEYYYDSDGNFLFAFAYDSNGNEYRYYFYEGKVYRYIDASGNVTDYKNGEDPYITEEIGGIYSGGELEKHYFYG